MVLLLSGTLHRLILVDYNWRLTCKVRLWVNFRSHGRSPTCSGTNRNRVIRPGKLLEAGTARRKITEWDIIGPGGPGTTGFDRKIRRWRSKRERTVEGKGIKV